VLYFNYKVRKTTTTTNKGVTKMAYRIYFVTENNENGYTTVATLAEAQKFVENNPKSRVFCGKYEIFFHADGTYHCGRG